MRNLNYIALLAFLLGAFLNSNGQDTTTIKKKHEKRIVIIRKSADSLPNSKDTVEINMNEDCDQKENCDHIKIPAVISGSSFNFGFANVTKKPLGLNSFYSEFPELDNGKSFGIGLEQSWGFNLIKGKLRLWTGLRYDIHNYRFNNPSIRLNAGQSNFVTTLDSGNNTQKSKVVVNYLGIPLAIGYQQNPRDNEDGFFIKAGVTAGYLVRGHTKVKTNSGKKEKEFDDFNFNDFALTPFLVVGYNSVALYGRMTTTGLFKPNQGPEANAFEFGLLIQ